MFVFQSLSNRNILPKELHVKSIESKSVENLLHQRIKALKISRMYMRT